MNMKITYYRDTKINMQLFALFKCQVHSMIFTINRIKLIKTDLVLYEIFIAVFTKGHLLYWYYHADKREVD